MYSDTLRPGLRVFRFGAADFTPDLPALASVTRLEPLASAGSRGASCNGGAVGLADRLGEPRKKFFVPSTSRLHGVDAGSTS